MRILYLVTVCVMLSTTLVHAQAYQKQKKKPVAPRDPNSEFLEKQWWLGFKGGLNFSKAVVDQSYGVITPADYDPSLTEKKYDDFSGVGAHATVEVTFTFRQLSISIQPTYRNSTFSYSNRYEYTETTSGAPQLILQYNQQQQVNWLDVPLLVKYDVTRSKLRPYIQAGAYYGFLLNANKSLALTRTDYASGAANTLNEPEIIVGATDLFANNHWGLVFGGGVNYHVGNIRVNLDILYRHGMSLVNSTENRYGNDRLTGSGDVMDDIKLNNIGVSLGCLFPLRFLSNGFQSIGKR